MGVISASIQFSDQGVAQNEDIKAREVPFANIFLSAKPEYQIEKKYYDNIKKMKDSPRFPSTLKLCVERSEG